MSNQIQVGSLYYTVGIDRKTLQQLKSDLESIGATGADLRKLSEPAAEVDNRIKEIAKSVRTLREEERSGLTTRKQSIQQMTALRDESLSMAQGLDRTSDEYRSLASSAARAQVTLNQWTKSTSEADERARGLAEAVKTVRNEEKAGTIERGEAVARLSALKGEMQGLSDTLSRSSGEYRTLQAASASAQGAINTFNRSTTEGKSAMDGNVAAAARMHREALNLRAALQGKVITLNEFNRRAEVGARNSRELAASVTMNSPAFQKASQAARIYTQSLDGAAGRISQLGLASQVNLGVTTMMNDQFFRMSPALGILTGRLQQASGGLRAFFMTAWPIVAVGGTLIALFKGFQSAARAGVELEDAIANVRKTTGMSQGELDRLTGSLQRMSTVLPSNSIELLEIASAAGRLGIQGVDNIEKFTETIAKLGIATRITGEEGGTQLARFLQATGVAVADLGDEAFKVANILNELENNTASAAEEILQATRFTAGLATQAGLSREDILALNASLVSLGVQAEAGGSAITRTFGKIAVAVAQGGDQLEAFSKVAGVTTEEFQAIVRENPADALELLARGLANARDAGRDMTGVLIDLGIVEVRERRALLALSGGVDTLTNARRIANEEGIRQTSIDQEVAIRTNTVAVQTEILKNNFRVLAQVTGEQLTPTLASLLSMINSIVGGLARLLTGNQDVIEQLDTAIESMERWEDSAAAANMALQDLADATTESGVQGAIQALASTMNNEGRRAMMDYAMSTLYPMVAQGEFQDVLKETIRLYAEMQVQALHTDRLVASELQTDLERRITHYNNLVQEREAFLRNLERSGLQGTERYRQESQRVEELRASLEGLTVQGARAAEAVNRYDAAMIHYLDTVEAMESGTITAEEALQKLLGAFGILDRTITGFDDDDDDGGVPGVPKKEEIDRVAQAIEGLVASLGHLNREAEIFGMTGGAVMESRIRLLEGGIRRLISLDAPDSVIAPFVAQLRELLAVTTDLAGDRGTSAFADEAYRLGYTFSVVTRGANNATEAFLLLRDAGLDTEDMLELLNRRWGVTAENARIAVHQMEQADRMARNSAKWGGVEAGWGVVTTVQRTEGAFVSLEDAMQKLLRTGNLTGDAIAYVERMFKGATEAGDELESILSSILEQDVSAEDAALERIAAIVKLYPQYAARAQEVAEAIKAYYEELRVAEAQEERSAASAQRLADAQSTLSAVFERMGVEVRGGRLMPLIGEFDRLRSAAGTLVRELDLGVDALVEFRAVIDQMERDAADAPIDSLVEQFERLRGGSEDVTDSLLRQARAMLAIANDENRQRLMELIFAIQLYKTEVQAAADAQEALERKMAEISDSAGILSEALAAAGYELDNMKIVQRVGEFDRMRNALQVLAVAAGMSAEQIGNISAAIDGLEGREALDAYEAAMHRVMDVTSENQQRNGDLLRSLRELKFENPELAKQYDDLIRKLLEYNAAMDEAEAETTAKAEAAAKLSEAISALSGFFEGFGKALDNDGNVVDAIGLKYDTLRTQLEALYETTNMTADEFGRFNGLLNTMEGLENVKRLVDRISGGIQGVGRIIGGLGGDEMPAGGYNQEARDVIGGIGDVAKMIAPQFGPMIDMGVEIVDSFLAMLGDIGNGAKQTEEFIKKTAASIPMLSEELVRGLTETTRVSRGGILGLFGLTKESVDEEATQLLLRIAGNLASGLGNAFTSGIRAALEGDDDWRGTLQEGIKDAILQGIIQAFVEGAILEAVFQDFIANYTRLIGEGDYAGAAQLAKDELSGLYAAAEQIVDDFVNALPDDLRPDRDDGGSAGRRASGRQVSEITGPTRDLLTDLLRPLAYFPSMVIISNQMLDEARQTNRWLSRISTNLVGVGAGDVPALPGGGTVNNNRYGAFAQHYEIGTVNIQSNARNTKELVRDISRETSRTGRGLFGRLNR